MQGWRKTMEDSHIIALNQGPKHNTHIFGVFDGHGGREVAVFVQNHFVKEFLSNQSYLKGDVREGIKETFLKMDSMLLQPEGIIETRRECEKFYAENNEKPPEMTQNTNVAFNIGCTANILVIDDNELYFANAGDSRSILIKKGEAISMSIDHKPELPNELSRITKAGGKITDGRVQGVLNLTRSIGDLTFKQLANKKVEEQIITSNPDILYDTLTKDCDFIVIGCDGIWDCITNEEMAESIYDKIKYNPSIKLTKILEEMFERNLAKNNDSEIGCDNMTCIIVQFKKSYHY